MAVDKVPVNEFVDNALGTHGVVRRDVVDSLIRKHNSPAKGVVWLITLMYLNFVFRILEFEANPQI